MASIKYIVKAMETGLMMLKASNRTSGRCLFFFKESSGDKVRLVALLFYKKENAEAPKHLIETAHRRMREFCTR